ncbi:MAG: hypothetical protein ACYCXO_14800 [Candidatus Humimicrobiaceae bacterium]
MICGVPGESDLAKAKWRRKELNRDYSEGLAGFSRQKHLIFRKKWGIIGGSALKWINFRLDRQNFY